MNKNVRLVSYEYEAVMAVLDGNPVSCYVLNMPESSGIVFLARDTETWRTFASGTMCEQAVNCDPVEGAVKYFLATPSYTDTRSWLLNEMPKYGISVSIPQPLFLSEIRIEEDLPMADWVEEIA